MKRQTALLALFLAVVLATSASAQMTLKPDSPLYNAPYDSLLGIAQKGIATSKILGGNAPKLYIMFASRAIEVNPDAAGGYTVRAALYTLLNDLDNADKDYSKSLDLAPDNLAAVQGLYDLIVLQANKYAIKDVPKPMAQEVFKRSQAFIKLAPESMAAERLQATTKGYIYKLQAESPEAMKEYVDAVNSDSSEAIAHFEKALPLVEKTDNLVMTALVCQGMGEKYFLLKNFAKAKALFQKAIATKKCDGTSYELLARILNEQENKPADAEKLALGGFVILPGNAEINDFLAEFYLKRGKAAVVKKDYAGAAKELEKYLNYGPREPRGDEYLAVAYVNLKKFDKAGMHLEKARSLSDSAEFAFLFPNAQEIIAYGASPGKKVPVLTTLLIESDNNEAIYDKGTASIKEGKYDEGITLIQQALDFYEKNNYAIGRSLSYNGIGTAYHHKKEYEKAKEYYNKSIAVGARTGDTFSNLAVLLLYGDKNEDAGEKMLLRGIETFPGAGYLKEKLGDFYDGKAGEFYEAKNYSSASTFYEKEVKYNEKADTYVFLGFCYYKMSDNAKCREAFNHGLELDDKLGEKYTAIGQILDQIGR